MRVFESLDDFRATVGLGLGARHWHTADQAQIDAFADRPAYSAECVFTLASTTP